MDTINTILVSFDKSDFKELLIFEMVNHMKENWADNEVIELFLDSEFNFVESNKSKSQKVSELISQHKNALNRNTNKIDL